jgi:hypothetical protein
MQVMLGGIKVFVGTSRFTIYTFASISSLRLLSGTGVSGTLSVYPLALRRGLLERLPSIAY